MNVLPILTNILASYISTFQRNFNFIYLFIFSKMLGSNSTTQSLNLGLTRQVFYYCATSTFQMFYAWFFLYSIPICQGNFFKYFWQFFSLYASSDSTTQSLNQGILKGEVSLYRWPPVWLVWNQLYDNWQFLFAKRINPNQSNRRTMVLWYFPL